VRLRRISWSAARSIPAITGIAIFSIVFGLGVFSARIEYNLLYRSAKQELVTTTKLLSEIAADPLDQLNVATLRHLLKTTARLREDSTTIVFDRSGRILTDGHVASSLRHQRIPPLLKAFLNPDAEASSWEEDELLVAAAPIRYGGRVIGGIRRTRSISGIRQSTMLVVVRRGILSLVLAVALSLLAWRLLRSATRPLEQLADAIDGLRGTGRITPLPRTGPIEVQRVSRSFSMLLSELRGTTLSKKVLSGILDGIGDGLLVLREDGHIDDANTVMETMCNKSIEELKTRDLVALLEGENRGSVQAWIEEALNDIRKTSHFQSTLRRDAPDTGLPVLLSLRAAPRVGGEGFIIICLVRDISELKKVEEMKARFLATISHELRTPMTSIKGTLGLMAGGAAGKLPESARRMVEIALSNTDRMLALINDLLDLEKAETGKLSIVLTTVDLSDVLSKAVDAAQGYGVEKNLEYRLEIRSPAQVCADPDRLHQIIMNLLSNASKYAPENSEVGILLDVDDHTARIDVLDRGPGVPPSFRRRLFDRFSQAGGQSRGSIKGSGLGLALARELIERMKGRVSYLDREEGGACFRLEIPRAGSCSDSGGEK